MTDESHAKQASPLDRPVSERGRLNSLPSGCAVLAVAAAVPFLLGLLGGYLDGKSRPSPPARAGEVAAVAPAPTAEGPGAPVAGAVDDRGLDADTRATRAAQALVRRELGGALGAPATKAAVLEQDGHKRLVVVSMGAAPDDGDAAGQSFLVCVRLQEGDACACGEHQALRPCSTPPTRAEALSYMSEVGWFEP